MKFRPECVGCEYMVKGESGAAACAVPKCVEQLQAENDKYKTALEWFENDLKQIETMNEPTFFTICQRWMPHIHQALTDKPDGAVSGEQGGSPERRIMTEHTKGKLKHDKGFKGCYECLRIDGVLIAIVQEKVPKKEAIANAHQFVKCWNAFEKDGLVEKLVGACKRGHQRLLEMGQKESRRTVKILQEALAEAEKE